MDNDSTIPLREARVPVRAIRIEVLEGPAAGRSFEGGQGPVTVGCAHSNDLVIDDPTVSRYHLALERREDRIEVRDLGSTNGTTIGPVMFEEQTVAVTPGTVVIIGRSALRLSDGDTILVKLRVDDRLGQIRGQSAVMQKLMASAARLAGKEVPVTVLGETGTGKELVAQALHEQGPRASGPFVTVDCGAIAQGLYASELFGHERGAFTGATQRRVGAFEHACGGTLFLDEIGELPPTIQAALLGVLERRQLRRVGGNEEIPIDVRLVSATNRDLRAEVNAGTFRLDLYYRLAVVLLEVPPLRARLADIPLLVEHFLREAGYDGLVEEVVPAETMQQLVAHRWPGNVRELRNHIETLLAIGPGVAPGDAEISTPGSPALDPLEPLLELSYRDARGQLLHQFEERYLRHLLERSDGKVRQAARTARMDRSYLTKLLRRHDLP